MQLADVRVGERVRWTADSVSRTGQVCLVFPHRGLVGVTYFSSFHRDWVWRELSPADLDAVTEEAET
jgi:hypothetical protein